MRQKAGGENPLHPLREPPQGISQPPWLPLTRELSPQATEGENLQSVCSEARRECGVGRRESAKRASAASAAVMPQGAAVCGD